MRTIACVLLVLATACSDDGALGPEGAFEPSGESGPATGGTSEAATSSDTAGSAEPASSSATGPGGDDSAAEGEVGPDGEGTAAIGDSGTGGAGDDLTVPPTDASESSAGGDGTPVRLPVANAAFDYQLGGAYDPPRGTEIVVRDRTAPPANVSYDICYVNGFQTQPHEQSWWEDEHPELLLRDDSGDIVIDPDWDEALLDIRTEEGRAALAEVVGAWIRGCADDGYDAVEIDNLDTYSRSGGRIMQDHAVAYMSLLSAAAHEAGLAIAQKNAAELLDRRDELGTDFVIAEECNVYDECQDYRDAYGDLVFVVEYEPDAFEAGCDAFPELSIVLRDLDLVTPDDDGYVYEGC